MIIITGCAGFVGSNIAKHLLSEGYDVQGIDDLSFGDVRNIPKGLTWQEMRFEDAPDSLLNENDILIHAATANIIYAVGHPVQTFKINAEGAIGMFHRFSGKIINLSTASVYGNANMPTPETAPLRTNNAYDSSKLAAEGALRLRGNYTTLRLSNVYGENQRASTPYCGVVGKMVHAIFNGRPVSVYGYGESTRDYTYVGDVVEAVRIFTDAKATNSEFNIATGKETGVLKLVRMIDKIIGVQAEVNYAPRRLIDNIDARCLDSGKAKRQFGWSAKTTLEEGLIKTVKWYADELG